MEYKIVMNPSCRTCEHSQDFHYPWFGMPNVPPRPCRLKQKYKICKCKEYLPSDNLEYLEYMEKMYARTGE